MLYFRVYVSLLLQSPPSDRVDILAEALRSRENPALRSEVSREALKRGPPS